VAIVEALGEIGPDPDIRDLALWLEREHGLAIAATLYQTYYVPLSHLFASAYAFSLMRHVEPNGTLSLAPAFPWARRSAVRMADGCTGLLAAHIADRTGSPSEAFHRYASAHLDRLLTPALVFAIKGARRSTSWRRFPRKLGAILEAQSYADATTSPDSTWPQAQADEDHDGFYHPPGQPASGQTSTEAMDDYLAELARPADSDRYPRHRRGGEG